MIAGLLNQAPCYVMSSFADFERALKKTSGGTVPAIFSTMNDGDRVPCVKLAIDAGPEWRSINGGSFLMQGQFRCSLPFFDENNITFQTPGVFPMPLQF